MLINTVLCLSTKCASHQVAFNNYGNYYASFQRGTGLPQYINSTGSYGLYWRSKTFVTGGTLSGVEKGGVLVSTGQPGLNLVAFPDTRYAKAYGHTPPPTSPHLTTPFTFTSSTA